MVITHRAIDSILTPWEPMISTRTTGISPQAKLPALLDM